MTQPKAPDQIQPSAEKSRDIVPLASSIARQALQEEYNEPPQSEHTTVNLFEDVIQSNPKKMLREGVVAAEGSGMEHEQILRDTYKLVRDLLKIVDTSRTDGILRMDQDRFDLHRRLNSDGELYGGEHPPIICETNIPLINTEKNVGITVSIGFVKLNPSDADIADVDNVAYTGTWNLFGLDEDATDYSPQVSFQDAVHRVSNAKELTSSNSGQSSTSKEYIQVSATFVKNPSYFAEDNALVADQMHNMHLEDQGELSNDTESKQLGELIFLVNSKERIVQGSFGGESEIGFGALATMEGLIKDAVLYVDAPR